MSLACDAILEESELVTSLMVKNPTKPLPSEISSSVSWFLDW